MDGHLDRESLLAIARQAALQAYAPYSHFRVGAAVVVATDDGPRIISGANVENASYGITLCAERSALAAACIVGHHGISNPPTITHVAVACIDAPADAPAAYRMPCGACRQWFAEVAAEGVYYVDGVEGEFHLKDLLPDAFQLR